MDIKRNLSEIGINKFTYDGIGNIIFRFGGQNWIIPIEGLTTIDEFKERFKTAIEKKINYLQTVYTT